MSNELAIDEGRAPLIKVFETARYRLVQQDWDEDGAWYQLYHRDGSLVDAHVYPLDEAIEILLDYEIHALTVGVGDLHDRAEAGEEGDIPF